MVTNYCPLQPVSKQVIIREFDVSGIFWGVLFIVGEGKHMTIEEALLSAHGYQLFPIATSQ